MDEDTEFVKLPVEDRCVHKLWKARVHGYEEATKLFQQIADEKSPEWNKFLGLVKKFVVDSNAVAQEKGLEAVLAFVENSAAAGKTVGEVMSGIVAKCIGAPKAKTKDLAAQISLMYIEIEKQDLVMEELLKGTEHKNPKVVAACINVITQAIREFGVKVITVKPIVKKMPSFLEDRDKTVREEGKIMVVEIYRWIGPALNPQLGSLKPVQMTELEAEFDKVKGDKAIPTRYLRSQQAKQAKIAAEAANDADHGDEDVDDGVGSEDIDPYELMEPVDILSKLPKDFYDKIEAKKWQERKEAMDTLEGLLKSAPKLENGDYFEVVKTLKKIISKDTNVVVVTLAGKNLAGLANGLKKRFQQYAPGCVPVLLEKFREKKTTVVAALKEAIDAVFQATTLEAIQEDVISALENKNPSVKSETASFLARCFTKCTPIILNKKLLKAYSTALVKTLNESDPTVRDSSAEALGTAMKVVGEKALLPFIGDVDSLKMSKIKEFQDKAEIVAKQPKVVSKPLSERPSTATVKSTSTAGSVTAKPVKRPQSSKKPGTSTQVLKKGSGISGGKSVKSGTSVSSNKQPTERELSDEEVAEKAEAIFSAEILSGLSDSNWKTRLGAVEQFSQTIGKLDQADVSSQLLYKIINKKPGVKDTNIQVAKLRLEAIKCITTSFSVSSVSMSCVLLDVAERLNDPKLSPLAAECLTTLSEATKLEIVSSEVLDYAFNNQKSPKVQVEVLSWLSHAIQEFGFQVQAKSLMENVRKGVSATNPSVRTAAISLLGTLYVYMGPQLSLFFENEKPALLQQINAEFEKHAGQVPKSPVRGVRKAHSQGDLLDDDDGEESGTNGGSVPNIQDIVPRVDITSYITDSLVSELVDKNWKVRAEALQKLQNILSELKFVLGSLGEAAPALAARLVDSNSKIAATTLALCQQIANAYGTSCKQYIRVFFPGFLQGMGDSKAWIRTAAIECINTYGDLCGYKEFFDGEMVYDALKSGSPTLRSEVWAWLAEKLPTIKSVPKDELIICLPILYSNLEDRNADVRKNASEAIVGIMTHIGYSPMMSACEKLKPASSSQIRGMLDKARGSLPEKPAGISKAKSSQSINKVGADGNKSKPQPGYSNTIVKSSSKTKVNPNVKTSAGGNRKKDDENESAAPLLQINNLKNQRCIDEQKLKTLKWNFTTPREEFVELLRDQMTTANVNKGLIANMFHADFKYHLRAIDSLSEDLSINHPALIANLDLILKWMTLRFFDTNPSVILKGLEYLQTVFATLIDRNYTMLESEAAPFIPYLVLKVGDPKDTVRNSVRVLFKQISLIYPVSKLFTYVMDGLKSKNARQRSECLEQLSCLIDSYGLTVCQPTPSSALKEIARHISDRDNSVRNGALNCIVNAYFIGGERILKMVGQISDKDMSLLEERIKRAAKTRVVATVKPMIHQPQQGLSRPQSASLPVRQTSPVPDDDNEEEQQPQQNQQDYVQQQQQHASQSGRCLQNNYPADRNVVCQKTSVNNHNISGDIDDYENYYFDHNDDSDVVIGNPVERCKIFLHFNEDGDVIDNPVCGVQERHSSINDDKASEYSMSNPISGPYGLDLALLENIESVPLQHEPPKLVEFDLHFLDEPSKQITSPLRLTTSSISPLSKMTHPATVEWQLTQIANTNLEKALTAMGQIETILLSEQRNSLQDHIDFFVTQLVNQLVLLNQCNHPDIVNCYRTNFGLFMKLYNYPELSYKVSESVLRRAVDQLLCLLTEKKLEMYDHTEMFARVVNSLVIRILERSDRTSVVCALLKILYDTVNNTAITQLYQELVMKCLWKVVKNFNEWDEDLDYDRILADIHAFLRDYPSSWWKKQPQDTPLRTCKTVLHTMVKLRGSEILVHVRQVKGVGPDSEIQTYCNKLIRTIKPVDHTGDGPHSEKKEINKPRHIPKSISDQLSEIFMKIGSKNETKEGLRLLYEFKQLHPEADVEPFLEKSTKFFQDYIQRGLQAIEMERRANPDKKVQTIPNMIPVVTEKGEGETNNKLDREEDDSEMQQFMKRLRVLQAKAGWSADAPTHTTSTTATTVSSLQSQNSNDIDTLPTVRNTSMESNSWKSPERSIDVENVESIRQRLEKLKKERGVNL
ncbi:msps cytoskeleton-associated protein 5 isoform X2 [Lycorma delicatula]|uniref:msps cytoskeleton-associated protein 5 isoform X2 n=1 Tax=Lycorma delicatula TaxID=130591 RepID=UPI003F510832